MSGLDSVSRMYTALQNSAQQASMHVRLLCTELWGCIYTCEPLSGRAINTAPSQETLIGPTFHFAQFCHHLPCRVIFGRIKREVHLRIGPKMQNSQNSWRKALFTRPPFWFLAQNPGREAAKQPGRPPFRPFWAAAFQYKGEAFVLECKRTT